MGQTHTVGKVATTISQVGGMMQVVYHQTAVVRWDHSQIILDHGGWQTTTTKTRMNQAANQYDLDYYVYQKNFTWYVHYKGQDIAFQGNQATLIRH